MKNNVFKVVLLQALPASGKSEVSIFNPCLACFNASIAFLI